MALGRRGQGRHASAASARKDSARTAASRAARRPSHSGRSRRLGSLDAESHAAEAVDGAEQTLRHMFSRDFVYVLGGVLPLAVSALILPALTRLMGREQVGIVSLAVAIETVLYVLLNFGMQIGVQRVYPREQGRERAQELVMVALCAITVLTALLALSANSWAGIVGASQFPWAMQLTAIWSGASAVTLISLGFLRAADRIGAFMLVALLQSVGAQLAGVTLLLLHGHSARWYLIGQVLVQLASVPLVLAFVRPRLAGIVKLGEFRRSLKFALPLVPIQLSNFLLWSGDRIVVQRDLGSVPQARYAVAYAVGAIAINITSQLNQAWLPRVFAIRNVDERRKVLVRGQRRLIGLLVPGVLGISLATPFLLALASPGSYHPYRLVFVALLVVPAALPYSSALANTRTLLAHGKSGRLAASTFTSAALNMVLNILLVPHLGITGSALATLIAYACQARLSGALVRNELDRLPNRVMAELFQWLIVGICLATVFIPLDVVGTSVRVTACVAALAVFLRLLVLSWRGGFSVFRSSHGRKKTQLPTLAPRLATEPAVHSGDSVVAESDHWSA